MEDYKKKYLEYKVKYIELKKNMEKKTQSGGGKLHEIAKKKFETLQEYGKVIEGSPLYGLENKVYSFDLTSRIDKKVFMNCSKTKIFMYDKIISYLRDKRIEELLD